MRSLQAVCSRYGLHIGAAASWFVRLLMWVCAPIAYPLAKVRCFLWHCELRCTVDFEFEVQRPPRYEYL